MRTAQLQAALLILIPHGGLLKANCWELLCVLLDLMLQRLNLWHLVVVDVVPEVLQLGPCLLLQGTCRQQGVQSAQQSANAQSTHRHSTCHLSATATHSRG